MHNEIEIRSPRILEASSPTKTSGRYLIYWMQQAQRADFNPALDLAIQKSNESGLPLVVIFVFARVPDANLRHYHFMLQGLWETSVALRSQGMEFFCLAGDPDLVLPRCFPDALEVITDFGYLRYQRQWRSRIAQSCRETGCGWTVVETEPLVPVQIASDKEEYAAATLRPKLLKALSVRHPESGGRLYTPKRSSGISLPKPFFVPSNSGFAAFAEWVGEYLKPSQEIGICAGFVGGRSATLARLEQFSREKLVRYSVQRNDPSLDLQSGLSPYLHFGQISSVEIIQSLLQKQGLSLAELLILIRNKPPSESPLAGIAAFAEELIIRRELSFNFCYYNEHYDDIKCLPAWAKQTLNNHLHDKRERDYSLDRLESCATDDKYWNAAQQEMMEKGKMHNYMRMYWGKRLLSWCESPEAAYQILLHLNNRYELDGRDPNAFAGVAWCFGKHDRPWQNRPVYGSVRYMNAAGLQRKFDMEAYLKKVHSGGEN